MFPGLACLPNTKCPTIPTKCSAKREMPTNTHEMLSKTRHAHQYPRNARPNTTRNAHQNPRNAQPNTKCPTIPTKRSAKYEMPTNTYEMPQQNAKSPPIPTKCFSKHEKPINTHEMLDQTRNAHQYPRNARPNTKSPHQTPTSPPAPLP